MSENPKRSCTCMLRMVCAAVAAPNPAFRGVSRAGSSAPFGNGCEFGAALGTPSAHIDNAKAAYEAMDHLYGFDDIRFARHTHPPLMTIAQPVRQIGEGTVQLLLGILAGSDERDTPASVTRRHTLIVRASTGRPRRRG